MRTERSLLFMSVRVRVDIPRRKPKGPARTLAVPIWWSPHLVDRPHLVDPHLVDPSQHPRVELRNWQETLAIATRGVA